MDHTGEQNQVNRFYYIAQAKALDNTGISTGNVFRKRTSTVGVKERSRDAFVIDNIRKVVVFVSWF